MSGPSSPTSTASRPARRQRAFAAGVAPTSPCSSSSSHRRADCQPLASRATQIGVLQRPPKIHQEQSVWSFWSFVAPGGAPARSASDDRRRDLDRRAARRTDRADMRAPVEKCVPIGALGLRLNTPQPPPERTHALPRAPIALAVTGVCHGGKFDRPTGACRRGEQATHWASDAQAHAGQREEATCRPDCARSGPWASKLCPWKSKPTSPRPSSTSPPPRLISSSRWAALSGSGQLSFDRFEYRDLASRLNSALTRVDHGREGRQNGLMINSLKGFCRPPSTDPFNSAQGERRFCAGGARRTIGFTTSFPQYSGRSAKLQCHRLTWRRRSEHGRIATSKRMEHLSQDLGGRAIKPNTHLRC